MSQMMPLINTVTAFLALMIVGYLAVKRGMVDDDFAKKLSKLLFNVLMPCFVITSMQYEFTPEILLQSVWLLLISATMTAVGFAIGWLFCKLTRIDGYFKRIITSAMAFPNFSFMGFPVAYAVFGELGLFYAVIISIPLLMTAQSVGNVILNPNGNFGWKKVLNPPFIAALLGFTLFVSPIELPGAIYTSLELIGRPTIPISMILVGLLLANAPLKSIFREWRYFAVTAMRLILFPLLVFFVLRAFGFEGVMLGVPVIIAMMPAAAKIIVAAANFGGDTVKAAQITMVTTLLSVLTIPIMVWILGL